MLVLTFVSLFRSRGSVLAEVGHELRPKPEVRPCAPATTTQGLVKVLRPMIEVTAPKVEVVMVLAMMAKMLLVLMLMHEVVRCDHVVVFSIVIRIWVS
jgi:hypothetical protein